MVPSNCFPRSLRLGGPQVAAQTLCPSVISTNPLIGQSTPSEIEQDLLNQQLQKALIILKDDGDREIVAWLQLARCVERFGHCCYRDEGLSADKVQAIATLKDCAVNDVCTWLKECRALYCHVTPCALQRSGPPEFSYAAAGTPRHAPISSNADSLDGLKHTNAEYSIESPSISTSTVDVSRAYHCTVCPNRRSFKNSSDWQKHEKEHEFTYICVSCMTNDVEGLVGHEALPNLNTELGSSSYKRRDALVRHLSRLHGIHEVDQGRAKADSWRYSSGRQAWSCGFCVQLFTTFHERLKHIGIEHFDKHQMIEGWDTNKQMMGLLLQPGVKAAWENIMAVYHPWGLPLLAWNHNDIGDLQLSLEMGPSDGQNAEALAMAVYTTARLDDRPSGPSTVVSQPNLDGGHLQNNLPQTASESIVPSSFLGYGNPIASSKSMSTSYHNYDDNEEEAASGMLAYSNQTLYK